MEVRCREVVLSTDGGIFVDAEGKCCRLSTYRVPSVDAWCPGSDFRGPEGTPIQIIFCF